MAGDASGQEFDTLFDLGDRPDVKLSGGHSLQNVFAEHQVFDVGCRHHHALGPGEAFDAADVKEAFDFFVHAADRLNVALLVDGTGNGNVLAEGQAGKRRGERVDLRGAGAVAVHSRVGLFEADAGGKRQRLVLSKLASQIASDDVHAFVMEAAAQIGFALDVNQTSFAKSRGRRDAHGFAERISANFQDAEAVHLADACTFHIHEQGSFLDHFA